jgi:ABC-type polar amino acid transport system ATPase subunit
MDTILKVSKVCSGYGELPVLQDIDLHVGRGEIVSVVGANGAGKTTLLLTLTGHLPVKSGQVVFDGQDVSREPAHAAAARGLMFLPLFRERFDLVMDRRHFFGDPVQKLLAFTRGEVFATRAARLGGYDLAALGSVAFNA